MTIDFISLFMSKIFWNTLKFFYKFRFSCFRILLHLMQNKLKTLDNQSVIIGAIVNPIFFIYSYHKLFFLIVSIDTLFFIEKI
ncbi:hypothetical protein BH747_01925 [Enterococcus villorum]|uniref:Uncharacterized protein n=1 Tax=Enterococcus villorum TaxID=112904 RepID=A0A1V8YU66_9ENTE|nr:hypothetical protein BH747_01925 [Enterococcus villorum]OQO76177.1 hypothetical protein BH744_04330 [Enterococcus villorum]